MRLRGNFCHGCILMLSPDKGQDVVKSNHHKLAFPHPRMIAHISKHSIGDPKDGVCLRLHCQKSSSRPAAISVTLDPKGRALILIQVLHSGILKIQLR